jgi:NDP-sugar pyrophosphorylase family protein
MDKLDKAAKVVADKKGRITNIFEREEHDGGEGYANTGLYVLDLRIFDYKPVPKSLGSREFGLPQTMIQAARNISIQAVPATFWVEIKTPEDLEKAEHMLKNLAT